MTGMDAATGSRLAGLAHIRQSVRDILTTRIGERVMRRTYGSDLPALVDRPMNDALLVDLYAATAGAIATWEPRIALRQVWAERIADGHASLVLEGTLQPDGTPIRLDGIIV